MKVVLFTRKPRANNFSMELITETLCNHFSPEFQVEVAVCKFLSNGILRRLYNLLEAVGRQGQVNHITGDVHYLALLMHKRRTILTIHDCAVILDPLNFRKRILKLFWFTLPVQRSALITVVSEATKRDLLKHVRVDPSKVHVVPSIVPEVYTYSPKPFDAECPTVLHVGTAPHKNLPRLAQALKGLRCRLIVVGRLGDGHHELLRECSIDYVNHSGISTERLLELYRSCDIVAFVSLYEGFGMPIVEANRVGRVVVTSNVASMPEVAGDAACIVDPHDVNSIRDGIVRVIEDADYRNELILKGLENGKRFEASCVARMYEALYRSIEATNSSPTLVGGRAASPAALRSTCS